MHPALSTLILCFLRLRKDLEVKRIMLTWQWNNKSCRYYRPHCMAQNIFADIVNGWFVWYFLDENMKNAELILQVVYLLGSWTRALDSHHFL
jgi:hypothetical protein